MVSINIPFFSICIPCNNRGDTIFRALLSVANQVFRDFELVIVDYNSNDKSRDEIIIFFGSVQFRKSPFRYVYHEVNKNIKTIEDWNEPLKYASGRYIAMLEGDDQFLPNYLKSAHDVLNNSSNIGIYSTGNQFRKRGSQGAMYSNEFVRRMYSLKEVPPPSETIFIRQNNNEAYYYNEREFIYAPEIDLYIRIASSGYDAYYDSYQNVIREYNPKPRIGWRYVHDHLGIVEKYKKHEAIDKILYNRVSREQREMAIDNMLSYVKVTKSINWNFAKKVIQAVGFLTTLKLTLKKVVKKIDQGIIARKQEYQKAGFKFKEQLPAALRKAAKGDDAAIRQLFMESSLFDFWSYYLCGPHYEMPWSGKQMTKLPMDYWVYRDLIESSRPEIILEIGTQRGTSALMLAEIGRKVNARVVTVDIVSPPAHVLEEFHKEGVIFVLGNATDKAVTEDILSIVRGKTCLVLDDGSHLKDEVIKLFGAFSKLVPAGGYYIVEDGFSNWLIEQKSNDALGGVDEILKSGGFNRCDQYDKFVFFSAFRGILKRGKCNEENVW